MAAKKTRGAITLKGSTDTVTEKKSFGINSIQKKRGVYPPENFKRVEQYGKKLFVSDEPLLKDYLSKVLKQIHDWLKKKKIQRIVLVITNVDSGEVEERWQFDIQCDKSSSSHKKKREKSLKEIKREIRDVIKKITASVTFLPLLEGPCAFDLLVYTDKDKKIPEMWEESGPRIISNSEEVRLRSFTTTIHKVDTMVSYKSGD
ncbi:mitotic spindle assembly checkpoint protein MAD2A-like [Exaiptasia diaphana]|uniref:Mitotic spindle assembly checkpoint protein MAD2A n=1 Tax=Exaiptasia diaphana TaxID=2652724 RepID=A0A913YZX3_EXADI|nr:mitotic spindle assembly checkpoint protein MAD2A-like [Exaiptasia diaphana]